MLRILLFASDPDIEARVGPLLGKEGVRLAPPGMRDRPVESVTIHKPQVVVVDLALPNDEGWTLLKTLRDSVEAAALPIVCITALDSAEERLRAFSMDASDVILRPFEAQELVLRVRGALASLGNQSSSLRGRLETYSLPELLQSCERCSWSGLLQLRGGGDSVQIRFENGKIIRAEAGYLTGVDALWTALDSAHGEFLLTRGESAESHPPILASLRSVLIDVGWAAEELADRAHFLPAPEAPISFSTRNFSLPEVLPGLPLQAILDLLESRGPLSLTSLLLESGAAAARVRLAVAVLVEKGAVTAAFAAGTLNLPSSELAPASPIVSIFYTRAAHSRLQAFLTSLPPGEHQLPMRQGESSERGEIAVARGATQDPFRIRFEPLSLRSVSEMFRHARESTHVVLWLGFDLSAEGVPMPLQLLNTAANRAESLLLVTEPPETGTTLLADLGEETRWRCAPDRPRTLGDLLRMGASAGRKLAVAALAAVFIGAVL